MATTSFTNLITLTDASWFNDADKAAYAYLTGVAGTNTITATGPASLSAYAAGNKFHFVPAATNTGATTINITQSGASALGAKNVYFNGAACVGGEIKIGVPCVIIYDGTQFQLSAIATSVSTLLGLGTGVATALAVNVGSAGAPVVNGGALGTPSSGSLANCSLTSSVNALSGNVALNNTATFFDGPLIPVDTAKKYFVSGYVTLTDTVGANFEVKLWDNTTVYASTKVNTDSGGRIVMVHLSAYTNSTPAAGIRISVRDITSTGGTILFNASGGGKDSQLTGIVIG